MDKDGLFLDPTLQASAVDIKVVALTSLLIEKGVITEKEIIEYTQGTKKEFIENLDHSNPNTKKDVAYLDNFFKGYE